MKAFICVGIAIIGTLLTISWYSSVCTKCCDGNPCNPKLYAEKRRIEKVTT